MSTTYDAKEPSFRFSQLFYDTRYRSITIQVIALILVLTALAWLVNNTVQNLATLGKEFSFKFLWSRAGYDIGQTLIPYTNDSTHGRAAIVGILNTFLVAILGCALATVVGVVAGVLRLSKSWLISRLMAFYVEGFRNVPVLLWIVLIFAVLTETTPAPSAFRGENPTASMYLFDSIAITNRGTYIPAPVIAPGAEWVVAIFILSLVVAFFFRRWAHKQQERTGEILPVLRIMLGIIVLPTLIAYFIEGDPISFERPVLSGFNFQGGVHILNQLTALTLALALYTGSYIAEIVRAGILSVSKGQTEAAFALGLQPGRTMNLVILPQALRVIIPPLISQFLNLTKNSSLAIAIGYQDVRATLGGITMNQTGRELECMLLLMGFYLLVSLTISGVMNVYNKSVALKER